MISGVLATSARSTVSLSVTDPQGAAATLNFDWLVERNAALAGSATQSSTLPIALDVSAAKAADGNRNGNFDASSLSHTDFNTQPWWQIDLGERYEVSHIELFNREDCCQDALQNFHVLLSDTPMTSSNLRVVQAQAGVLDLAQPLVAQRQTTLDLSHSGRFLRIQLQGADYLQLAEVEIYGYPAAGGTTNFAPQLDNPGDQATRVNTPVNLQMLAQDLESDPLSFAAQGTAERAEYCCKFGAADGHPNSGGGFPTNHQGERWAKFDGGRIRLAHFFAGIGHQCGNARPSTTEQPPWRARLI